MVTLTALTALASGLAAPVLLLLPELVSLLELHAAAASATAAIRTGVVSLPLRDGNLVSLRCFTMLLLFPFVSGGSSRDA